MLIINRILLIIQLSITHGSINIHRIMDFFNTIRPIFNILTIRHLHKIFPIWQITIIPTCNWPCSLNTWQSIYFFLNICVSINNKLYKWQKKSVFHRIFLLFCNEGGFECSLVIIMDETNQNQLNWCWSILLLMPIRTENIPLFCSQKRNPKWKLS